jgi:NAD(P)-dependent dehydrogenase (short-subunit alcohol dehydrogenase family)
MLGSVDHLLCFAGVVGCQHALDMTAAEWRRVLDINTTGGFLCAQAVAKQMVQQGRSGSIIFVASISGHRVNWPQPQVGPLGVSIPYVAMSNSSWEILLPKMPERRMLTRIS